jgi:hypothetical protein
LVNVTHLIAAIAPSTARQFHTKRTRTCRHKITAKQMSRRAIVHSLCSTNHQPPTAPQSHTGRPIPTHTSHSQPLSQHGNLTITRCFFPLGFAAFGTMEFWSTTTTTTTPSSTAALAGRCGVCPVGAPPRHATAPHSHARTLSLHATTTRSHELTLSPCAAKKVCISGLGPCTSHSVVVCVASTLSQRSTTSIQSVHRFAQPHRYSERMSQAVCDVECHDVPPVNVRLRGGLPHAPFCTTPPPCTHTAVPPPPLLLCAHVAPTHQRAIVPPSSFHSSVAADALPLVVFLPACVAWFFSFVGSVCCTSGRTSA